MAGEDTAKTVDKTVSISDQNETLPPVALASEAKQAASAEHEMTLWQAIKTYPHAIGWSILLSSTLSKIQILPGPRALPQCRLYS